MFFNHKLAPQQGSMPVVLPRSSSLYRLKPLIFLTFINFAACHWGGNNQQN
ncbi:hypothetical protein O59_003504 [Cellvibrio sp. BR]|nr:hypothetical protein O59_003504 [Cellvibrio sp. BR]